MAGVISGAEDFKPGIVLDRREIRHNRRPVALLGKVFCKADAQFGSIGVGDLLTTSPTPGCAMSASDPLNYQGKRDVLLFPLALMMSRNVLVMQIESGLYRPGERDPVAGDIQLKCLDSTVSSSSGV